MATQFTTNAISWDENTDTVTIKRKSKTMVGNGYPFPTVWTGQADVQYNPGQMYYTPSGATQSYDAVCYIDADSSGTLPAIQADDQLFVNGDTFVVMTVEPWNMAPKHLELKLNRGGLPYHGGPK